MEIVQDVRYSGYRVLWGEGAPMRKTAMEQKVDIVTAQIEDTSLIVCKKDTGHWPGREHIQEGTREEHRMGESLVM